MRHFVVIVLVVAICNVKVKAEDGKTADRQIAEALRDVHDQGADIYNDGDTAGGYRMYQGGLIVARGMLSHRPGLQKFISSGLKEAEREANVGKRALLLHELIEKVRADLRPQKDGESLTVPPREIPTKKPEPKPTAGVDEVKEGLIGKVLWQGSPVGGVEIMFVSLGRLSPVVIETATGPQGVYTAPTVTAGKYVVLIVPGPTATVKKLPERYAFANSSPLRIDVKAGGEKVDFMLQ